MKAELLAAVERVIDHGWYILGPEVDAFESRLATRLGLPTVIGVNSGTDALLIALRAAGVGAGDEVITVSHSFVATATAVRLLGATPVFVDVDDDTMCMDPTKLAAAVTPRTKAVLPVHLNGHPADVTAIGAFCRDHGLQLVEDAAQAIGAEHAGRSVCATGIGAWSLHPLKVLSALGDGGFVTLPDRSRDEELRQWRNLGLAGRGVAAHISGNSRLDALQAAMLCVKLDHLDAFIDARRAHAAAYREALAGAVRLPPVEKPGEKGVYSAFVVRHPRRDALVEGLAARGVDAKSHYPVAIHQMAPFADLAHGGLPVTERVVDEIVSLPVTPELDASGRARVIEAVLDVTRAIGRVDA
ncbi:MAG: DegT/DnrJ/EryC1/StrS family aminotransferase [Alphaproteobacteria bacterium]|nr:DegT/DnrJ/EryC1/StrS family aminotransferase [Alphaproteobacteria bacterium]